MCSFILPTDSEQQIIMSTTLATSMSMVNPINLRNGVVSFFFRHHTSRFFCRCSQSKYSQLPSEFTDTFSKSMQMAALKPHHRIAIGVSGGADSMALCALMAHWKTFSRNSGYDSSGFVEGLLAIIVDHGLRPESKEEAETVSHWVSDMGIRYEIVHCDWPDGQPKVGHLEEDARDLRYKIFQDVCLQNQIGVLLTAHHADDQAELFILRLSRNSGVLGLAGMASTSQLFPKYPYFISNSSDSQGILLVRPLMEFSKEDLYKHGYAVIDLESLNPSERDDICLSRCLAVILQFISQRHRPVRGSASRLLLDYIRTVPCKLLALKGQKLLSVAQFNPLSLVK
ncbi:uncharacterized protein LOC130824581 isoform X2 [Amaranthus tricolor]|uniref:uncharacterized protein LOC130824581 isoform X2 n=1 Tax=Amaranthus tricolor TaxID=29722 RepID=UPI00259082AB|nr:uncharacterized protein LOC130824581 isoform X2 [Amaranthus tricolor]